MPKSTDEFDSQRLLALIAEKLDGSLQPAGHAELEAMLAASQEACALYWETVCVHSNLELELAGESSDDDLHRLLAHDQPETCNVKKPNWGARAAIVVGSLAVCLLVAAMIFRSGPAFDNLGDNRLAAMPILGELSPLVRDSHWTFGRPGDQNPGVCRGGDTILLDRGAARLQFTNNTIAELSAPVTLQIVAIDRVRVLDGRIRVDVPEGAEGFTVETASAEVVDLGTSFSVEVANNNTDLVVFQGEVDLTVVNQNTGTSAVEQLPAKRFREGEAVRIAQDGTLSRIIDVHPNTYDSDGQVLPAVVIGSVEDNIVRDDFWSFYEIVPGGLQEDARSFVDRPHEWNGATNEGIPSYLIGADYVKTFCDDKITPDLTIEVELQHPAAVYVFFDKRLTQPTWLVEQFSDTGDEIGIDEAFPKRGHHPKVGAGNGIQRTFTIWKLVTEESVVSLGPNGDPAPGEKLRGVDAESAMYGIAAVRLEDSQ